MEIILENEVVSLLVAAGSAIFAAIQYWRNSRQAAAVRAADEIELFYQDPKVKIAESLIDYSICTIPYEKPSGEMEIIVFDEMDFNLALRHHEKPRCSVAGYERKRDIFLSKALAAKAEAGRSATPGGTSAPISVFADGRLDPEYAFSGREHFVRNAFDRFLGRLERIEALIESKVISAKNFEDRFSYWIRIIGDPKAPVTGLTPDKRKTLLGYINAYEFNGVIRLFKRYGKDISVPRAAAGSRRRSEAPA